MEPTDSAERPFDFSEFVRQPRTIARLLSWLFSMVVFACITTEGYVNSPFDPEAKCIFNQDYSTCRYAVSIGVIGFLACVFFLLLDVYVPYSGVGTKRRAFFVFDLGFSGMWTFLWFVCFCLLAAQWTRTKDTRGIPKDAAHATIAFSFFSMATWGIQTYFALARHRREVGEIAIPTYMEPPPDHHTPYPPTYAPTTYTPAPATYSAFPSRLPDNHQQPTFTSERQPQGDNSYQPSGFQQASFQQASFQQPSVQPGLQQPSVQQPGLQQPGLQQPGLQQPSVQQPGLQQPSLQQPGLQQPGLQQPSLQQPGLQQPGLQQPGLQQPGLQQPGFQQPSFQQPSFQQPGYTQSDYQSSDYQPPDPQPSNYPASNYSPSTFPPSNYQPPNHQPPSY